MSDHIDNLDLQANCGTGAGGFKPGNKCQRGGGGGSPQPGLAKQAARTVQSARNSTLGRIAKAGVRVATAVTDVLMISAGALLAAGAASSVFNSTQVSRGAMRIGLYAAARVASSYVDKKGNEAIDRVAAALSGTGSLDARLQQLQQVVTAGKSEFKSRLAEFAKGAPTDRPAATKFAHALIADRPRKQLDKLMRKAIEEGLGTVQAELGFDVLPDLIAINGSLQLHDSRQGQRRTFEMQAYDGGLLRVHNYPYPVVVDLKGLQQAPQVKALLHHDPKRPAGHMTAVVVNNTIATRGKFDFADAETHVVQAQGEGYAWESSIGCTLHRADLELIAAGETVQVNSRTIHGPCIVARKATLREVSFVGIGAGEQTAALAASAAFPVTAVSYEDVMADNTATTVTNVNADPKVVELTASLESLHQKMEVEHKRLQTQRLHGEIDRLVQSTGLDDVNLVASLREKADSGDITDNQIELEILRASQRQQSRPFQPWGQHKGDGPVEGQVLEAAFMLNTNWTEDDLKNHGGFDDKTIEAALSPRFNGFGLNGLGTTYLNQRGHSCYSGKVQGEDLQAMLAFAERELTLQAAASTVSLPGIMSNVARKEILRGRTGVKRVIPTIARTVSTTDFKEMKMYRLTPVDGLVRVAPDGKLEQIDLAEDAYKAQVFQWGRSLNLTEVMFANDDGNAFADLARQFGYVSVVSEEQEGIRTMLANVATKYTAENGNRVPDHADAALSMDSLDVAYTAFLSMKNGKPDITGKQLPIMVEPKYLLTGPANATTARSLHNDTTITIGGTASKKTTGNPWQGMFAPLHSPFLGNGMVDGATGKQWFMLGANSISSVLIAAYRNNRRAPQVRSYQRIPGMLGFQWDIVHEFGMSDGDVKNAVYSKGEA